MGTCTREGQSFRYLPGWLGVYQIWRVSCALPPDVAHDPNRPRTSLPSCRRQDLTAHGDDEEEDGELQLGKQRRTWSGRREEDGRHRPLRREEPTEHTAAAPTRASIAPHRASAAWRRPSPRLRSTDPLLHLPLTPPRDAPHARGPPLRASWRPFACSY